MDLCKEETIMKQRGATLIGILFIAIIVIFAAVVAMKVVPMYLEYWSVAKVMKAMGADPQLSGMTPAEVRASFDRRASIDNIKAVSGKDLEVSKEGGTTSATATWSQTAKLFGNLSVVADFNASTGKPKPLRGE